MAEKTAKNIIKTREDDKPFCFVEAEKSQDEIAGNSQEGSIRFNISEGCTKPSWASDDTFDRSVLRQRIEPWLTSLFQSDHLSLLAGSGLTHAIHGIVTGTGA